MHCSGSTKDLAAGKSAGLIKRRLNGVEKPRWLKLFKRRGPGFSPRFSQPNASETGSGTETREKESDKIKKESSQDSEKKLGTTENGRIEARFNGSEKQKRNARAYRRWLSSNTNAGISNILEKRYRTSQEDSTRENARSEVGEVVAESCLACSNKRRRVDLDSEQHRCCCREKIGHDLCDVSLPDEGKGNLSSLEDLPSGHLPEAYKDYSIYVDKLLHRWNKGQNAIIVDNQLDQERVAKVVLFVLSLQHVVRRPFLIVSTSRGLSIWEAGFLHLAPSANLIVYKGSKDARSSIRSSKFYDGGGQIMFQVLLSCSDVVAEDVEVLKCIEWKTVIIDECQRSSVSRHFEHFKSLATDMRLLLVSAQIKDCPADYLTMLSLVDSRFEDSSNMEIHSTTKICQLKERLTAYMAYECKSIVLGFTEYWVPVWLSNVQLEQYCGILISNYAVLGSFSKNEPPDTLREIVLSTRKCCDHPYLLDQSLQSIILNDSPVEEHLNVEVQVSGKLLLLDKILPEIKTRGLRALIIFKSVGRSGKDSAGDILEDFLSQRFGRDSYARIDGIGGVYARSKRLAAVNKFNDRDSGQFVFLIDSRACLPSIKLCSVDTVILFDSDWDPQNDLKAIRRITINSQFEQLTVFRLYTCFTSEEMVLILAKKGETVDQTIDSMNRITCNTLLSWGVPHLLKKLDDLHGCVTSIPGSNLFSEWSRLDGVLCELLALLPFSAEPIPSNDSYISKVEKVGLAYARNISLLGEKEMHSTEIDDPLLFWKYLLEARHPRWYFLPEASSRSRRKHKFFCDLPKESKLEKDAVSCKGFNKQVDPIHLRPRSKRRRRAIAADKEYKVTEKGSYSNKVNRSSAMHLMVVDCTESPKADKVVSETRKILPSLQKNTLSSLKLELRWLCDDLKLPDNIKDTAVAFIEYIMADYNVSWKTISTFQAFQISVCWLAADFLKHKIDHKESLIVANLQCKEQEANYISSKLQRIKKPFALHLGSMGKVEASNHVKKSKATTSEREYLGGDIQISTNDVQMTSCKEQDLEAEQKQMGFESQNLPRELEDLEDGEIPPKSCYSKISKLTVPDLQDFEDGDITVGPQGKTVSGKSVDLDKMLESVKRDAGKSSEGGMLERVQSLNLLDKMIPTILEQRTGSKIEDNLKENNNDSQLQINKHENSLQASHLPSSIMEEQLNAHEMVQQEKTNQITITLSGGDCLPHTWFNTDNERQPCDTTAGRIGSENTIPEAMLSLGFRTHSAALPLSSDGSEISRSAKELCSLPGKTTIIVIDSDTEKDDELMETRTHGMATKDEGTASERANESEVRQSSQEALAATPFAGESFDLELTRTVSTMLQEDISTIQVSSFGLQQLPVSAVPSSGGQELLSIPTVSGMQCFQSHERSAFSQQVHGSGQQDRMLFFSPPGTSTVLPRSTAMHAGTRVQDYRSIAAALGCYAGTLTPDIRQLSSPDPLQIEIERLRKNDEQDLKIHAEMILRIKSKGNREMEKVHEKYDVLLQDAERALMQRRNERKANILKVYANKFLAEAWTIDLKAVSSGTKKGLMNELIHPPIQRTAHLAATRLEQFSSSSPLASLMEFFNCSTTLSPSVSPANSLTNNLQGGIHLRAPAPHLRASTSQPPVLPSYRPVILYSSLNQQLSSSSAVASVLGTTPAPRQLAGSHRTYLQPDVVGLPIYHSLYRNMS